MNCSLSSKIIEDNVCVIYESFIPDEIVAGGRIMLDLYNVNQSIDCFIDSITKVCIKESEIEVYMNIRYQELNAITHKRIDNVLRFDKESNNDVK